jgi:hypothetical protein
MLNLGFIHVSCWAVTLGKLGADYDPSSVQTSRYSYTTQNMQNKLNNNVIDRNNNSFNLNNNICINKNINDHIYVFIDPHTKKYKNKLHDFIYIVNYSLKARFLHLLSYIKLRTVIIKHWHLYKHYRERVKLL